MKGALWAEIRRWRLLQVEGLSRAAIARRLRCSEKTVRAALALERAPEETRRRPRGSRLAPHKPKIDALVAKYPELSAARILKEIRPGPDGYAGGPSASRVSGVVRPLLHRTDPVPGARSGIERDGRSHRKLHQTQRVAGPRGGAEFLGRLLRLPVRTSNHLRRVLELVGLFGRREVLTALTTACEFRTYDAAYVETDDEGETHDV